MAGYGNYDRTPVVPVPGDHDAWSGDQVWARLAAEARGCGVLAIDCYPGVDVAGVIAALAEADTGLRVVAVEDRAGLGSDELDVLLADDLTDDRVFGVRHPRTLEQFFRPTALAELGAEIAASHDPIVVVGWGASLVVGPDACVVLADLPRWEIQQRYRRGMGNWRADNGDQDALRKYKRGYFVEWPVADLHKRGLLARCDHLLDTSTARPALVTGPGFRAGLAEAAQRPFRVVPFFDPGPWGGVWMEEVCGLEPLPDGRQYAWCFDCVPEENSIRLGYGDTVVEVPANDLVLHQPRALLGIRTHSRFGAEFPIRFDLLDTMAGGNLSLQVHPTTDYIQHVFGMPYTQDESYYVLAADDDAVVYLGLRDGVTEEDFASALRAGQAGDDVDVPALVNVWPTRQHDHFSIPAGTVHCSGADSVVLEISATPNLFTFKLWDWGRVGLDGRPRPIHLEHGMANIDFSRRTQWTAENLVDTAREIDRGADWVAETTGLHELEFIETRRHSFTSAVEHDTSGTVHVLNLVAGEAVVVESPSGAFDDFTVHYAETFIVPAAVGRYRIRGIGQGPWKTLDASVRGTQTEARVEV